MSLAAHKIQSTVMALRQALHETLRAPPFVLVGALFHTRNMPPYLFSQSSKRFNRKSGIGRRTHQRTAQCICAQSLSNNIHLLDRQHPRTLFNIRVDKLRKLIRHCSYGSGGSTSQHMQEQEALQKPARTYWHRPTTIMDRAQDGQSTLSHAAASVVMGSRRAHGVRDPAVVVAP